MKRFKLAYIVLFLAVVVFTGCSSKSAGEVYDKSAQYWYQKIGDSIGNGDLDKADNYFISLKSEHPKSPLVESATMIIAHAHMDKEEYLLANYFFDEYTKKFGGFANSEYVEFMKIKASFLGIQRYYRDQKLIIDTIANAQSYIDAHPNSQYVPLVQSILIRLKMGQYLLNENVASLYDRTGKSEASKVYRQKNSASPINIEDIGKSDESMFDFIIN